MMTATAAGTVATTADRTHLGERAEIPAGGLRLTVIEDDPQIRATLERALRLQGHEVATAATGLEGLASAVDGRSDAVILDLGLPDIDGLELLRMIRAVSTVPVIAATARDDDGVIVQTLDAGADDYLVKPFSGEQLQARLRAVLRRARGDVSPPLRIGDLVVDRDAREVLLEGTPVELTPREFDLLAYLAARCGKVVSKRELVAEVWGDAFGSAEKSVDVHLSWLRSKLGESARAPRYIHVIRGVGVKLTAPR